MTDIVAWLDNWGQPAWIVVMVVSFILFWPIGLAVLGYLIWSGRMGCGKKGTRNGWQQRMAGKWERKMEKFGMTAKAYQPTGNRAFDEYREETLRRLEDEAEQFRDFLDKLRMAKDKAEFEQFMTERRNRPQTGPQNGAPQTSNPKNRDNDGPVPDASPA
ncbi:MAG: DUF2852 domain-containing protein [Hyphomicrobiaceae bacterium]